jgi:hypothetical protein
MNRETAGDELDLATAEFLNTYNSFRKAAVNLMAIVDSLVKENHRKPKSLSEENQQIHEFLIQMLDDKGCQIGEKCFGIRCVSCNKSQ